MVCTPIPGSSTGWSVLQFRAVLQGYKSSNRAWLYRLCTERIQHEDKELVQVLNQMAVVGNRKLHSADECDDYLDAPGIE